MDRKQKPMIKRILVPIDFSEVSMNALNAAHSLSLKTGSEIVLLHVIEDPNATTMHTMGITDYSPEENIYLIKLMEKMKQSMDELVNKEEYKDVTLSYKIEIGHPYERIAEVIADEGCSLIIMGSTGASGIRELLVGSVADKVVRYANCPVITVNRNKEYRFRHGYEI